MSNIDPRDAIPLLLKRSELLDELRAGPKHKPELQDALGVSRSTVYKAVRELEGLSLVESTDEGYRLSLLGRLLFDEFECFNERAADVCRPADLLALLGSDCELSVDVLSGADFVLADRHAPNRPVHSVERMVEESTVVKAISPVVLPQYVELFRDQIVEEQLTAELLLEEPVVAYLLANYKTELRESLESGTLDVWVTDEPLPYGLLVVEEPRERVGLIVYNESGELRGFVGNDSPAALEWGREMYRRFREGAVRYATNDW